VVRTIPDGPGLWLRHEAVGTELRTLIVPADAAVLVAAGVPVTVEESTRRTFPISEYVASGCRTVPAGSWPSAPLDQFIVGLKEPPAHPFALRHTHIFFGHAYKGQSGAMRLLRRFTAGGGILLDLESLTDATGRRLAAFGFWAGYVGAALAVLHYRGELPASLSSTSRSDLDARLQDSSTGARALVIGALGRSGRGASEALAQAGVHVTRWDLDETSNLDRDALLAHDILVNCVLTTEPGPPFLTAEDLDCTARRLTVVSDVTCDVTSACNRLPINDTVTDWRRPVRRLHAGPPPLDVLAIDNLPSLLPREASTAFSGDLLPHWRNLHERGPGWTRCLERFRSACLALTDPDRTDPNR
jgi:saccharopine dehydrogenase (NAD+, L-lysine forming)